MWFGDSTRFSDRALGTLLGSAECFIKGQKITRGLWRRVPLLHHLHRRDLNALKSEKDAPLPFVASIVILVFEIKKRLMQGDFCEWGEINESTL